MLGKDPKRSRPASAKLKAEALLREKFSQPAYLIRRAQQIANAVFKEEFDDLDLTPVQYSVLLIAHVHPKSDQARIAGLAAIDRTSCWRAIEALRKREVLNVEVNEEDQRRQEVILSSRGEALVEVAVARSRRVQQRLLKALPPDERKLFLESMRLFVHRNNDVSGAPPALSGDG